MKTLLILGLFAFSTAGYSTVVKSYDRKKSCYLYKKTDNGENGAILPISEGESVVNGKRVYGFTLSDLEVDFDAREAKLDININVVMGINQKLTENKAVIDERNPNFNAIINQINKRVNMLESVCLTSDNKIIYIKEFSK